MALAWVHVAEAKYRGLTWHKWADPYCESSGDPHNARNSTYRGKWQFDQWTWNRFAPSWLDGRDPAYVSEYWQDRVALRVTYDAWPHC
jgi:hypothetical protein